MENGLHLLNGQETTWTKLKIYFEKYCDGYNESIPSSVLKSFQFIMVTFNDFFHRHKELPPTRLLNLFQLT